MVLKHIPGSISQIWEYRSILYSLVTKNLFGRYKNSFLGFGWHFVYPIMMIVVYYIVYTAGIRSSSMPDFWVYLGAGIFPFNYMLVNLTSGANSIVGNSGLVKKIYFPRELLILSQVISSLIVTILGYVVVLTFIGLSGYGIHLSWLCLIPVFILMLLFVLGYVFIFASLTVYIRDIQYALSSATMIFYFLTPMYFTVESLSSGMGSIVWLNPFTYYVEAFHQIVYYGQFPESNIILGCLLLATMFFVIGLLIFRKLKHGFVERL